MMPEQVGPCADVAVHVLADNSAVVFNEATQQLFSFDPLATYLWCRWENGTKAADLASALDIAAGASGQSAQEIVDRCLAMWQRHRLIGDERDASRHGMVTHRGMPTEGRREKSALRDQPTPHPGLVTTELQVGGEAYRLCYSSQALAEVVRPLLGHLEKPNQGVPAPEFLLSADGNRFVLQRGGQIVEYCNSADELAPMVKFALNVDMLEHGRYALAFHSAAVVRNGRALLLPAASGHGKSVLTAALLHDGWGYLTDDSALLDTQDGLNGHGPQVRGVGFDLSLKASAWPILQTLVPEIETLPIHRRGDGHRVRYLPPPVRTVDPARAYPVAWIVFPRFRPDRECSLQPVAAAGALQRLLREAFAPSHRLSCAGFRTLARLVEDKPTHTLTYSSLPEAVAMLGQLCRVKRLDQAHWLIGACLAVGDDKNAITVLRAHLGFAGLDWHGLMAFANEQLLVPLLYDALADKDLLGDLPGDVESYLSFLAARNRERNKRLETQVLEACRALNRVGITPMPIKGVAELLETPPSAGTTRVVVGDLDILVQPKEAEAAAAGLGALGYSILHRYPAESHAVVDLYRPQDAAVIDLHRHPLGLPALLSGEQMWADGLEVGRDGVLLRLPSATDHLACRVLHEQVQEGNLASAEINRRSVYQVARTLQLHGPHMDLAGLSRRLQPHGLTTALTSALLAAHDLFGAPIQTLPAHSILSRMAHGRRLLRLRYPMSGKLNNAIGNMWSPFARYRYGPLQPGVAGVWRLLKLRLRHGVPALAQYGGTLARRLLGA